MASWPKTPAEARALQARLRARVSAVDRLGAVRLIAGADAHYDARSGLTCAAVALLDAARLELCDGAWVRRPTGFPYIPGLLSFREAPAVLEALSCLRVKPDLLLVDGHGLAHPRRFGLACHLGVLADLPTVGVAKARLIGVYQEPGPERGARKPLIQDGEPIGMVLRTRARVRPIFVSVGHRISLETAAEMTLRCAPRYRLPEPIRQADRLSRHPPMKD